MMKAFPYFVIAFFFVFLLGDFKTRAQDASRDIMDSLKPVITKMGPSVNSQYSDYAAVITADGAQLLFTSRRPFTEKEKKKGRESLERIYKMGKLPGSEKWGNAIALPENINMPGRHNSNLALSNDGQRLLLYRDDRNGNGDIYESHLKGSQWSAPEPLPSPVNSPFHESSASISPDGRTLYFVSDRKGGMGGRDIWKCSQTEDGNWGKAENLGSLVNTEKNEEGVFIHPDGKTLFFSSKGHDGHGGYDVFSSELKNGEWTDPVGLKDPVNTEYNDLFYVLRGDGKVAYYTRTDESGGDKDIYRIYYKKVKKEQPSLLIVKGVVTDAATERKLEAEIEITNNTTDKVIATYTSNASSGKYLFSLPSGKNYGINVVAADYLFYSGHIMLSDTASYREIVKNIRLNKIKVGEEVVLRNIFFDYGKSILRKESDSELKRVLRMLRENPNMKIEIGGHTDNKGSDAFNLELSRARAKAVVTYLLENGISGQRLVYKGYGETQPVADNNIEKGRSLNRRVSFKIIKY